MESYKSAKDNLQTAAVVRLAIIKASEFTHYIRPKTIKLSKSDFNDTNYSVSIQKKKHEQKNKEQVWVIQVDCEENWTMQSLMTIYINESNERRQIACGHLAHPHPAVWVLRFSFSQQFVLKLSAHTPSLNSLCQLSKKLLRDGDSSSIMPKRKKRSKHSASLHAIKWNWIYWLSLCSFKWLAR